MTKWLKRKNSEDPYILHAGNGAKYEIVPESVEYTKHPGSPVPDELGAQLLTSGEYVEVRSDWHEEREKKKIEAQVKEQLQKVPEFLHEPLYLFLSSRYGNKKKAESAKEERVEGKRSTRLEGDG